MPCTPPWRSMKPLTTIAISPPTTPPNNPSSKPIVNSLHASGRSERIDQIDGLQRIQFLQVGGRLGVVLNIVAYAQRELRGNLDRQRQRIRDQRIGRPGFDQQLIR